MSKYDGDLAFRRLLISSQPSFLEVDAALFFQQISSYNLWDASLLSVTDEGIFSQDIWFLPASNSNSSAYLVRTSKDGLKIIEEEENPA